MHLLYEEHRRAPSLPPACLRTHARPASSSPPREPAGGLRLCAAIRGNALPERCPCLPSTLPTGGQSRVPVLLSSVLPAGANLAWWPPFPRHDSRSRGLHLQRPV